MKRILISLLTIALVSGIGIAATRAFFSDVETSTGNTFTAGAIDLKLDNTSYALDSNILGFPGPKGVLVANPKNTWTLKDLTAERFFDFVDLKPGDFGEDTISVHVGSNDAWLCAAARLTEDKDNTCTGPEKADEPGCTPGGAGELDENVNFVFWVDDGDNVLETNEVASIFLKGPLSQIGQVGKITLADSGNSILGEKKPIPAGTEFFIGKAWCFGDLTATVDSNGTPGTALPQKDGTPIERNPGGGTGIRGTGIGCNPYKVDNQAQTDSVVGDLQFYAVQARNNDTFTCATDYTPTWPNGVKPPLDTLNIGDTTSEAGHSLLGWSEPWVKPGAWGGVYGGGSSDESFRLLLGKAADNLCDEEHRDATFVMHAGGGSATKLTLEHLDGQVNDSFDIFINGNSTALAHYTAGTGTETWKKTTFNLPNLSGEISVRLHASDLVANWCADWGQVAFSNAKLE